MSGISRNLNGPYARGVANPYTVHVHPYPTRYHGAVYTRPVFGTPYIRSPHAVFKPDDFHEFYGTQGLGSVGGGFGTSSIGNGTIGGNTLGLGATGTPIYYLASKTNTKVSALQTAINTVLSANRYEMIPVTGKLDALTSAAFMTANAYFREDLLAQVSNDIVVEASRTIVAAMKNATVKKQVETYIIQLQKSRKPVPAEPATSPPQEVPTQQTQPTYSQPVNQPSAIVPAAVTEPAPQQAIPTTSAPQEISIPEMEIEATPPSVSVASNKNALIIGGIAVAGLFLLWKMRSK